MKLENIIKFRDWLFDFTANMTNDYILGEQEILYMVKDKFSSLGLNDNKIDKEPIDEEKLDELANEYAKYNVLYDARFQSTAINAFEAGYRKAMKK